MSNLFCGWESLVSACRNKDSEMVHACMTPTLSQINETLSIRDGLIEVSLHIFNHGTVYWGLRIKEDFIRDSKELRQLVAPTWNKNGNVKLTVALQRTSKWNIANHSGSSSRSQEAKRYHLIRAGPIVNPFWCQIYTELVTVIFGTKPNTCLGHKDRGWYDMIYEIFVTERIIFSVEENVHSFL